MPSESKNPFDRLFKEIYDSIESSVKKEEFLELYKKLTERVVSVRAELSEKITESKGRSDRAIKDLEAKLTLTERTLMGALEEAQRQVTTESKNGLDQAVRDLSDRVADVEAQIPELPDYSSVFQDLEGKLSKLEQLTLGENTRNALEALPEEDKLSIEEGVGGLRQALDDIWEEIENLKRRPVSIGGGGGLDVSHWARHEAFTMNGVATSVTLAQGVGAAGTACIVRYQGQTLDLTSQYTVSGNQITLVGFIPEADTIISITYWP